MSISILGDKKSIFEKYMIPTKSEQRKVQKIHFCSPRNLLLVICYCLKLEILVKLSMSYLIEFSFAIIRCTFLTLLTSSNSVQLSSLRSSF